MAAEAGNEPQHEEMETSGQSGNVVTALAFSWLDKLWNVIQESLTRLDAQGWQWRIGCKLRRRQRKMRTAAKCSGHEQ